VRIQTITIYCPSSYRWSVQQQSVIEALTIACADIDYLVRFVTNVRQEKFSVLQIRELISAFERCYVARLDVQEGAASKYAQATLGIVRLCHSVKDISHSNRRGTVAR
jgi:hypothetical protein